MYEKLSDVPAPIAEFYVEEVRSEPTGNTLQIPYTYVDDDGVQRTGYRPVPEYADATYIVLKVEGERKTWEEVEAIVALGKSKATVDYFVNCALNHEAWEFFEAYQEHLLVCDAIDFHNDNLVADEEGNLPEPMEYPVAPVQEVTDPSIYYVEMAKHARDTGRYSPIESGGYVWDADPESYMNMTGTLESWDSLMADPSMQTAMLVNNGLMAWTMEDNSIVYVTKEELQGVVDAIRVRAGLLHAQYSQAKA